MHTHSQTPASVRAWSHTYCIYCSSAIKQFASVVDLVCFFPLRQLWQPLPCLRQKTHSVTTNDFALSRMASCLLYLCRHTYCQRVSSLIWPLVETVMQNMKPFGILPTSAEWFCVCVGVPPQQLSSFNLFFFKPEFPTKPECVSHINDNKRKKKKRRRISLKT